MIWFTKAQAESIMGGLELGCVDCFFVCRVYVEYLFEVKYVFKYVYGLSMKRDFVTYLAII